MSTAQDLIIDSQNFATTQAGNANSAASEVFALVAQMLQPFNIDLPTWNSGLVGGITPIDIGTTPEFTGSFSPPTDLPTAPDIAADMLAAYNDASPTTLAAINAAMDSWLASYAPGYSAQVAALNGAVLDGLAGPALDESFEQALYNRLVQRVDGESRANQRQAVTALAKRGYEMPQVALTGALNRVNGEAARNLAVAATEVYVERAKLELQHRQFCANLAATIQGQVRSAIVQFAGVVASLKDLALKYALAIGEMEAKTYELEADLFKVKLQAALAELSAAVDANRAAITAYQANLEAQATQRKVELERMRALLAAAEIPYKGELERNIKEQELDVQALHAAAQMAGAATNALSHIAAAAMSGINGIAHVSAEE